ncbi:MAG TPA: hypothetical protein VEB41_13010 [Burkholderiales bacterium]|nr:hypothetical protein [Burkholderiales bacterium]
MIAAPAWGAAGSVQSRGAEPARAGITLSLEPEEKGAFGWRRASTGSTARTSEAALYVASYENRLANPVIAGENRGRGRTLRHYVVL